MAYKWGEGGLYLGGLISGIIYSLANGWAYNRGGVKVKFYGISKIIMVRELIPEGNHMG